MLTRRLLAAVAALAVVVAAATAAPGPAALAQSDEDCTRLAWVVTGYKENGDPLFGWRLVNTCTSEGGNGSGGSSTCEHPARGTVPCVHPVYGWWSHSERCWVQRASSQPHPDDEVWDGHDPSEGAIYTFACPQDADTESVFLQFLAQPPDVPSIAELAQQAMQSLPLAEPEIGIAPDPDGIGLVGVYVWLWIDNADAAWGPVSVSVPGPGFTVSARGEVAQIEWDMGDGSPTVICDNPGEPYQASYGAREPDCGHVYNYPSSTQPDGRYHITVTTVWDVTWWVEPDTGEGGGEAFERQATTSVQINELQVVTS